MKLTQEILKTVSNYPGGYSLLYDIIYEKRAGNDEKNKRTIKTILSRLKKQGLVINKKGIWKITEDGKQLLKEKSISLFYSPKKYKSFSKIKKTMIIVFDIPEKKRNYRDWLRNELIGFNYELVQKSVWFGPALPKEFIIFLEKEKILQYIKFFKATKSDLI